MNDVRKIAGRIICSVQGDFFKLNFDNIPSVRIFLGIEIYRSTQKINFSNGSLTSGKTEDFPKILLKSWDLFGNL